MRYKNELKFLINVLDKIHLDTFVYTVGNTNAKSRNDLFFNKIDFIKNNFNALKDKHLYKLTTDSDLSFKFLLLPEAPAKTVLFVGPFLKQQPSAERVLEIGETFCVPPHQQQFLSEYYSSLPVLAENSLAFTIIETFCEAVWDTSNFVITEFLQEKNFSEAPFSKTAITAEHTQALITAEAIERRYAFENQLIHAVEFGQLHMESQFTSNFSNDIFEKRTPNALQNAKNYCIILNTLLRKGAENGGVHPVYLNQVSTDYALKIESLSSSLEVSLLMREMFRAYCRLVRKHNIRRFTPVVQKTILHIDSDLSSDLSTKTIAQSLGVSLGYLSAVFKKETGKTLSEYVCVRRMDYAEYLLKNTSLQIQTVALHCGVMDVHYFSKLFKKHKGKTPSLFRRGKS